MIEKEKWFTALWEPCFSTKRRWCHRFTFRAVMECKTTSRLQVLNVAAKENQLHLFIQVRKHQI